MGGAVSGPRSKVNVNVKVAGYCWGKPIFEDNEMKERKRDIYIILIGSILIPPQPWVNTFLLWCVWQ